MGTEKQVDMPTEVLVRTLLILATLGLSACADLGRSSASGYHQDSAEADPGYNSPAAARASTLENEAREELGLGQRPLRDEDRTALDTRIKLKRAEGRIATKREKKQYYSVRTGLKNDAERLYFLSLPTLEARARWAANRGIGDGENRSEEIAKTIEAKDIALGMSQKGVLESWGDPDAVESAGNPLYGYERWKYNRYISGNDGYRKEMRIVYFEGGHVVGWERP